MNNRITYELRVTVGGEQVYLQSFDKAEDLADAIPEARNVAVDSAHFNEAFANSRIGQRLSQAGGVPAVMQNGMILSERDFKSGKTLTQLRTEKSMKQASKDKANREHFKRIESEGIPQDAGGNMTEEVWNDEVLGLGPQIEPPEVGQS